ncbi:hypothetical protein LOZ12_006086 [Ophidiomyces ophidiicola]|nr:hypothetical protein LOZ62_006082 [Ophidiomyces ophidiicola]KAI1948783.1 hypothetical protein LOZ59_006283 [Ophidiomyces ophidiicola]KAI2000132.1 hypothetical protein LOZ50_006193 [Ophidiomyces ophidiicola]KAI2017799.1 hypothetical protein LOZ45_006119 [Ophidiomyces ophidiicola]KAI2031697.1 hypothetical protein LOZ47_006016 [Ophidiomyces ophidiicola]
MDLAASNSPATSRRPSAQIQSQPEAIQVRKTLSSLFFLALKVAPALMETEQPKHVNSADITPNPLVSSKLGNMGRPSLSEDHMGKKLDPLQPSAMDKILAKLSPKNRSSIGSSCEQAAPKAASNVAAYVSSVINEPTGMGGNGEANKDQVDNREVLRLQQELMAANSRIAMQEQELAQTRVIKQTLDQAMGPSSEVDFGGRDVTEHTLSTLQHAFNASSVRPLGTQRQDFWVNQDDSHSDVSEAVSAGGYNQARGIWNNPSMAHTGFRDFSMTGTTAFTPNWGTQLTRQASLMSNQRISPGPGSPPFEQGQPFSQGLRRSVTQVNRNNSCFPPQSSPWGAFTAGTTSAALPRPINPPSIQTGLFNVAPYHPRPIGTPLSPTAAEFTSFNSGTWTPTTSSSQTYVSPLEPMNYRRLLDKSVSCDWKYIVDKIVCNNDQQASIFLQQKLKVGTSDQKYEIIEAIVSQAYPLMVNRFGNFLVQRCFEHGTPEQVISIANAIRGNTLSLSMDPFGCHVIQKAFDCVPEEHKAVMVHELLRRIPETVIHRYACHVWQKLFELRWSNEPPQIMAKVNEALRGMWHEVALGETGSLVVQNIFENCVEDEKRPAIEEVLAKIDLLAHGQFGNWCIQHICEHGAPHDKSRAIEHILSWATDYSMDQFASKVVEKCLKIGGSEFLDRYLTRVCTGRPDRPRMPLIDIAGDQYGNYLIQWILMNAATHQRELVASHIRKHMVSLRGSKFGSRVAMLCCNPSHVTRPGPGAGLQVNRFTTPNEDRFASTTSTSNNRFNRSGQWTPAYPPFR